MNNDLISREDLKKFINEVCFSEEWVKFRVDNGSRGQIECILSYIDNAPTIEEKSYAMGYQDGVEDEALDIKPHGKWEFFSIGDNQYTRCSLCKDEHIGEDTDLDWWYDNFKYCPKCGAYMRKETQK